MSGAVAQLSAAFLSPASEMSHSFEQLGRVERLTQVIRCGECDSGTMEDVQTCVHDARVFIEASEQGEAEPCCRNHSSEDFLNAKAERTNI